MGRFKMLRVGALLAVLIGVGAWAGRTQMRRTRRTDWSRPVHVAIVLLGEPPTATVEAWRARLPALERWLDAEAERHRAVAGHVVRFELYGPVSSAAPAFEPSDDELLTRLRHAWDLSRALARLDARAGLRRSDVRIYAVLEPGQVSTVEGTAELGGEVGMVHATFDEDVDLSLSAVAHELFHCLGATDKYDDAGHARQPEGLVDPDEGLPQSRAEIMVGEVPLAPGRGRLPTSLDEIGVGAVTAEEIRWTPPTP